MQRKIIPDVVQARDMISTVKDATAGEVAAPRSEADIAAIVVTEEDGKLIGILTERDLTRRVVAEDKPAGQPLVGDIMTANPDTLSPSDSA